MFYPSVPMAQVMANAFRTSSQSGAEVAVNLGLIVVGLLVMVALSAGLVMLSHSDKE